MDHFHALELPPFYLRGIESGDSTGKLSAVQVADSDHLSRFEFSVATGNTGRQQASATLTQRFPSSIIDQQRAFGMVKESNPPFAPLETGGLGHEDCAFLLSGEDTR